jgi:cation transport regulator
MPYDRLSDLPQSVREHLPQHAQEIFRAAFNNAWDEYQHDEERAFRVAWGAVERDYTKDEATGQSHKNREGKPPYNQQLRYT